MVDKRRFNHPIKRKDIGLSVPKEYSFLYNHQKGNKENSKKNSIDIRLLYYLQVNISWKRMKRVKQLDLICFKEKDLWRIQRLKKSISNRTNGYNPFKQKANS